ncbi:MAG: hypothetical protein J6Y35_07435 [Bacteroidales bacterium]|nr:hypothetical protein [Bacteroidales bacterium]
MKLRVVILCLAVLYGCSHVASYAQSDTTLSVSDTNIPKKNVKKGAPGSTFVEEGSVTEVHTTDSVLRKKHNPKIAIALSAILPGAGQIYNRKAWKVPIIYAGLEATGFCVYYFAMETNKYKWEYRYRMQGKTDLLNPSLSSKDDETILSMKKLYQRRMEVSIAALTVVYVLNLIDAIVDAHLFYFDISDDLSMRWSPAIQPDPFGRYSGGGVSLTFSFK